MYLPAYEEDPTSQYANPTESTNINDIKNPFNQQADAAQIGQQNNPFGSKSSLDDGQFERREKVDLGQFYKGLYYYNKRFDNLTKLFEESGLKINTR